MELRKIYSKVGIHKPMESLFSTFVIYSTLKLQIDNPFIVLLGLFYVLWPSVNFSLEMSTKLKDSIEDPFR
jgi:hypothetical protein